MKYSEAQQGRVFIIRLEDGDIFHEQIERFAKEKGIERAWLNVVGGADKESRLVVGPEESRAFPVNPMVHELYDAHEIVGAGTLFPDDTGAPVVHLHMACGREENTVTGCVRNGVKVWHVMEVILVELLGSEARRMPDKATGFKLLVP
ncbi:DNA-binding protein [Chlorobaculum thiosulfatiphilum]|uniref:DNA-binding protein n=1 Tax=Chlorobaculum thiosulfatiphilum TaxID=115852 RepID=A0A5C4S6P0_CHLTI|nr:PPC domain-containing DNA-binding protein [Chlorobaculum thiosulfatiphilum]TNJ39180.1 DNA-binding protein [Chlorobaculum thiosulfatiphilum]